MKPRYVVLTVVASLVLSIAALFVFLAPKSGPSSQDADVGTRTAALTRAHAATIGKPDAKVHIVEFLDPACETCAEFYPFVKKLMARDPDRIRLSVRHVAFHKGADFVVRALEAAKKQDKYWQVLEALLSSQRTWVVQHTVSQDAAWAQIARLDLDVTRLKADMDSPDVAKSMSIDAQDAKTLKVVQTPEYFVNGKQMPSFGYRQLQELVAQALASAYP